MNAEIKMRHAPILSLSLNRENFIPQIYLVSYSYLAVGVNILLETIFFTTVNIVPFHTAFLLLDITEVLLKES